MLNAFKNKVLKLFFKSEDQIVRDIIKRINQQDIVLFKKIRHHDLIYLHNNMGRFIRNEYKLWNEHNPYTRYQSGNDESHPDNMSMRIIQKLWKYFNQE